jgi:hypothetical protein
VSLYFVETPYPDELFFSVAARTRRALRNRSSRQFSVGLVGSLRLDVDLGIGLPKCQGDFIQDASPFLHTTLVPFLKSFIAVPLRRTQLLGAVEKGEAYKVVHLIGKAGARRRAEPFLRYCPRCADEQKRDLGEAYWTRLPQVVGLTHCPVHGEIFASAKINRHRPEDYTCFEDAELFPAPQPMFKGKEKVLIDLSAEVAQLLEFEPLWDSPRLNRAWEEIFFASGIRPRKHGAAQQLTTRLENRFGASYLAWALCPLSPESGDSWVVKFLRNPAKETDPLRHILVLRALDHRLNDLTRFGEWIFGHPRVDDSKLTCGNPVCSRFEQTYRKQTRIFRHPHLREEVAQFTCLQCHQTTEQLLAPGADDSLRIVDRGSAWDEELVRLWNNPEISVRQIGVRLGAESLTIKRHALKAGLAFPRQGPRMAKKRPLSSGPKKVSTPVSRSERRKAWLEALKQEETLTKARDKAGAQYAWLQRHDKEWFDRNRPARTSISEWAPRVDWVTRENELLRRVDEGVAAIMNCEPPRMCSMTALLRAIGAERYGAYWRKMPRLCNAALARSESRVSFALRRIEYVVKGLPPGFTREDVRNAAGLRREMVRVKEIALRIEKALVATGKPKL